MIDAQPPRSPSLLSQGMLDNKVGSQGIHHERVEVIVNTADPVCDQGSEMRRHPPKSGHQKRPGFPFPGLLHCLRNKEPFLHSSSWVHPLRSTHETISKVGFFLIPNFLFNGHIILVHIYETVNDNSINVDLSYKAFIIRYVSSIPNLLRPFIRKPC